MIGIKLPSQSIGYVDIPKTASSSIKYYLYQLEYKKRYEANDNSGLNVHQYFKKNLQNINDTQFKFILLRDPLKRFLSVYSNRVVFYNCLCRVNLLKSPEGEEILNRGLVEKPDLSTYIKHFLEYKKQPSLWYHTKQLFYILKDTPLSYFDKIYTMENLTDIASDLNQLYGTNMPLPKEQTGGPKYTLADISKEELYMILEYCREDYELLKDYYSKEAIIKEWEKINNRENQ